MKRKEPVRHLEAHGCPLKREGGSHSIYWNPNSGRREPVPRHAEIPDLLKFRWIRIRQIAVSAGKVDGIG